MRFSELKVCGYTRHGHSYFMAWEGEVERWEVCGNLPEFDVFDREERRKYDDKVTLHPHPWGPSNGKFTVIAFKEEGSTT